MYRTLALLLAGAALTLATSAGAATLCSAPGLHPDFLDVSDVSYNGTNATDCNGVFTGVATASTLGFDGFSALAAAQAGSSGTGDFGGATFTLEASATDIVGTWSLAWTGVTGPLTLDLVAVVQTATSFASYFFDDLVLTASPGSGKSQWVVSFLVNEDTPLLTSFALFARDFRSPTEPPPPTTGVPEPGTLALLALGTMALGVTRRRPRLQR